MSIETTTDLAHYGVPGMKWGVRKGQKPKSTPTKNRKKSKPLSTREKVMVGSLIVSGGLLEPVVSP